MTTTPSRSSRVREDFLEQTTTNTLGKNYLFAIGIDEYTACTRLFNCVKDAKDLVTLLTNKYQFDQQNTYTLFNEAATAQNIFEQLDCLLESVTPQDNLVVYFSGHGEYDERLGEGYWIPVEAKPDQTATYLSCLRILNYIRQIKSHHTLFLVDSCYAGSFFSERSLGGLGNPEEAIDSRWMFCSGRLEKVSDGKPGSNSPFAENLLYFLNNNTNAAFSVLSLIEKVKNATVYNTAQTPRGEPIQDVGHKGGQFFFHLKDTYFSLQGAEDRPQTYNQNTSNEFIDTISNNTPTWIKNTLGEKSVNFFATPWAIPILFASLLAVAGLIFFLILKAVGGKAEVPKSTTKEPQNLEILTIKERNNAKMHYIEGGTFLMGQDSDDPNYNDERPVHKVTLRSFYMDETEVTNQQYVTFLNQYKSNKIKEGANKGLLLLNSAQYSIQEENGQWLVKNNAALYPVVGVTWYGANEYAKFYGCRLPTESEWEYAARGGAKSQHFQYAGSNDLAAVAWSKETANSPLGVHPCATKKANELGLFDLSGNAWEWCSDWYGRYYDTMPPENPQGEETGTTKVFRGGSWYWQASICRIANRGTASPENTSATQKEKLPDYGFRCVR